MFVENEAEIPGLSGVKARMGATLLDERGLEGRISGHADAPRSRTSEARHVLETARAEASAQWAANSKRRLPMNGDELKVAAVQTILDELRQALDVQRCTF